MATKAFRIRRQTGDGETLHPPKQAMCHACYRPIEMRKGVHYCGDKCRQAHQRLTGTVA